MFESLRKKLGFFAATSLPEDAPKPAKNRNVALPGFVKSSTPTKTDDLARTDLRSANTDILSTRTNASGELLRRLSKTTPDLSAARSAYLRTGLPQSYKALARNTDGTFNRDATLLLQQILTRLEMAPNYAEGFTGVWTLRSLAESFAIELLTQGACAAELILDAARLPTKILPVPFAQIVFGTDRSRLYPRQKISGGDPIDLNQSTFFVTILDQDLLEPYPDSPFEAAVQAVLAESDFFNDLRKIVKRAFHPRIEVSINEEKFRKTIPESIRMDPVKVGEFVDGQMASITQLINDLGPEDALIHFDYIEVQYMTNDRASPGQEAQTLQELARARVASGAKVLPSTIGQNGGSQNVASTESMLFLKNADSMIRMKVNEHLSRILTLALRLFGQEVYAEFRFDEISLRPELEMEAFYLMRQDRIKEQWSLGLLTDDEASLMLTGNVAPAGFKTLSGTMFHVSSGSANASPYSTTGSSSDKQGAQNENLAPDTPTGSKGRKK